MDNRLTDFALVAGLDAGHQNLPWNPGQPGGLLASVDLKAIMKDPHAAAIVPSLPVQPLYYALKQQGLEESLDVLPLLTDEQVVRLIDYEAWSHDRLDPKKLFDFLKAFGEVNSEELYRRFSELDEEYQLASMQSKVRVYEFDSIDDLSEDLADRLQAMPCGKVFYEILTEDQEEYEVINSLIEASKEHNTRYAYALLGHAAYAPPNEIEDQVAQFRKARLEEDGFISFNESLELFAPIDRQKLSQRWNEARASTQGLLPAWDKNFSFLDLTLAKARDSGIDIDELFRIHQGFLYLANALCAAARVEPDDVQGLHRLLEQGKSLASLGLESLAKGQLDVGLEILRAEAPKTLFKVGISIVEELRQGVVDKVKALGLPGADELARYYAARQWGKILVLLERQWLERIGLEATEILKGLFNRFPMFPFEEALDDTSGKAADKKAAPRIIFQPIYGLDAFRELEISVAVILGTFACVVRTGFSLNQPFELILREAAIQSLARGVTGSYVNFEEDIPQLLQAWRDGLRAECERWYVGDEAMLDEVLNLVSARIHDGLHGLIILPARGEAHREERI